MFVRLLCALDESWSFCIFFVAESRTSEIARSHLKLRCDWDCISNRLLVKFVGIRIYLWQLNSPSGWESYGLIFTDFWSWWFMMNSIVMTEFPWQAILMLRNSKNGICRTCLQDIVFKHMSSSIHPSENCKVQISKGCGPPM